MHARGAMEKAGREKMHTEAKARTVGWGHPLQAGKVHRSTGAHDTPTVLESLTRCSRWKIRIFNFGAKNVLAVFKLLCIGGGESLSFDPL